MQYGDHFALVNLADSKTAKDEVKRKTYENLKGHCTRLNDQLKASGGNWYLGKRSFTDTFLYVLTRWLDQTPLTIDDYPALKENIAIGWRPT